ncbi:S41 family peptidase [Faunimonas sp. B44]|uniref:S41 family peptidase n=1 Tax=Faunimonas sp. B44 TaxID=3461493 RepID=UPI0040448787
MRVLLAAGLFLSAIGTAAARPVLDTAVAPTAIIDQIGEIVRREHFDPVGLAAFDAAEARARARAERGDLARASEDWLRVLGASHTGRFTPDGIDYYELSEVFRRGIANIRELFPPEGAVSYPGIGLVAAETGDRLFVRHVYDGGPAARGGILVGDEILSVDGAPYAPIASFEDKVGRAVRLEFRRRPDEGPRSAEIVVARLQPREMFLDAIRDSVRTFERGNRRIGYLRLWAYAFRGVDDLLAELLTSDPLREADGLVLDMRGRWGGAPADAAEMFVGRAPHMVVTNRKGESRVANMRWRKPVVGIIDQGSRSGMEILAHGLQRAGVPLVGTRTAGDVLAGRAFRLRDNSLLEVAVLDVHVDGERLEGTGVSPEIVVPFDSRFAAGADPQRDRALDEMMSLLAVTE